MSWMCAGDTPGWTAAPPVAGCSICSALECVVFELLLLCLFVGRKTTLIFLGCGSTAKILLFSGWQLCDDHEKQDNPKM